MPLVNQTFPGLYNGVSQQPPTLRLDTQGELQENALSDLVDGLQNRPPTEWISNLTDSAASSSAFFHTIQRSETEKYIVVITEDATSPVEVYTIDGQKCTIRYGTLDADGGDFSPDDAVKDYVLQDDDGNPVTPRNAFKAVTVADYTILTNIKRIAKMKDTASPDPDPEAIVYVKRGVASADYNVEVFVNGSQVGSASYSSDDTTEPDTYKTTEIASSLQTDLAASLGTGWTLTSLGSSFTVKNDSQTPFSIKVSDSYGNDALVAVNHTVQDFADLPPEAPDGYVVKVEGDAESSFDNFYVQYRLDEDGTGIWSETVKPGIQNEMDEMTLPHRLVRTGELEFTLAPIVWSPRGVGDESSAPAPSFIGRTVNNVFPT